MANARVVSRTILLATAAVATTAGGAAAAQSSARQTAACSASPELTEGPYYTDGPPKRSVLATPGTKGTRLVLTGRVVGPNCVPRARARVDFWQADAKGNYDNTGYKFRGYQLTDTKGRYRLVTVVPGLYPGRTEHIHVKVTPKGGSTLTTQLFFPGVAQNDEDGIFDPSLVIKVTKKTSRQWTGAMTFVA